MRSLFFLLLAPVACLGQGGSDPYPAVAPGPTDTLSAGDDDAQGGDPGPQSADEDPPGDEDTPPPEPPTHFDGQRVQWWVPTTTLYEGFRSDARNAAPARFWDLVDIDGDGRADLIHTADPTSQGSDTYGEVWGVSDQPYWKVYLNDGTSFEEVATRWYVPDSGTWGGFFATAYFSGSSRYWALRDLDGDGLRDLVQTGDSSTSEAVWGESDAPYWRVFFNTGSGFEMTPTEWPVPEQDLAGGFFWFNVSGGVWNWFTRDMNGDGRLDLVHSGDTSLSNTVWGDSDVPYWKVYLNDGTGFELDAITWQVPIADINGGFHVDDYDGVTHRWDLVDLTGDDQPDLVHTADTSLSYTVWGQADVPYWKVYVNTGAGFEPTATDWLVPAIDDVRGLYDTLRDSGTEHWQLIDMDRDGLADLVQTADTSVSDAVWGESDVPYWKVFFNTGDGFDDVSFDWLVPDSGRNGGFFDAQSTTTYERWWVGDLDGDGLLELVQTADTSNDQVWGVSDVPYWRVFHSLP